MFSVPVVSYQENLVWKEILLWKKNVNLKCEMGAANGGNGVH